MAGEEPGGGAPSPDGQWLATIADNYVLVRRIDELEAHRLDDSRGAFGLSWSPDSATLAYISDRGADGKRLSIPEVRRVSAGGSSSTTLAHVKGVQALAFGSADTLYLAMAGPERGSGILALPIGGGELTPYLEPRAGQPQIRGGAGFTFLPDGTLVCVLDEKGRQSLVLRTSQGFEPLVVAPEGGSISSPVFASPGFLLYVMDSTPAMPAIWALPFDLSKRAATGKPVLVASAVVGPSPTNDGSLYFVRLTENRGSQQLVWVDRAGRVIGPIGQPQVRVTAPSLSPDGRFVAVRGEEDDNTQDVWLHDVERRIKTRLSSGVVHTWRPTWSPGGRRIVFQSRDGKDWGRSDLYMQDSDGRTPPKKLVATDADEYGPNWSPDGRFIAYTVTKTDRDLWVVDVGTGTAPRPLLATQFTEQNPSFSPDGKYIAYASDRTGQGEIFVTTFPEPGREIQVSSGGGASPQWARGEIVYFEPDTKSLMSVPVSTAPDLKIGSAVRLFSELDAGVFIQRPSTFDFAITARSDRFICVQDLSSREDRQIGVRENWVNGLTRQ